MRLQVRDDITGISDEIDLARAREYALLATLLARAPDAALLKRLAMLSEDETRLGAAHAVLADAAGRASEESVRREYFDLFAGLGDNGLMPYSSFYLAGSLYGRPLARLRETLRQIGVETASGSEPEDHAAILCEVMAGLVGGGFPATAGADRDFFKAHLAPWLGRFFADLEKSQAADFYAQVGSLGRIFIDIESEAFALPDI